jgi:hypothetical protein
MLHSSVGSLSSGASVLVHEYPSEPLHPVTVGSGEHEDGSPVMPPPPPSAQQYVPAAAAATQLSESGGVALPVQLSPVSVASVQVTVESVEQESVVTLAEQPAPVSKSDKNPRAMNQEIRMRVRLSAFARWRIYSDSANDSLQRLERLFTSVLQV